MIWRDKSSACPEAHPHRRLIQGATKRDCHEEFSPCVFVPVERGEGKEWGGA